MTQKNTMMSKNVAQYPKTTKIITFSGNHLFHRFPVDTWKAVLTISLKDICHVTESFRPSYQKWYIYIYFSNKKRFSLTRTMYFLTNLWKSFQKKFELFLLKIRNFSRKTVDARFFLWTRKKQFWKSFRKKLPKSQNFSLLVWKHEQFTKLSKKLMSHKLFLWRSIRHF